MAKPKFWMGVSSVGVVLTAIFFASAELANSVTNTKIIEPEKSNEIIYTGSDYREKDGTLNDHSWERMIKDSYKFCEQTVEQGTVLLKNSVKDGKSVLPLAENERKVTLLGVGSKNMYMRSGSGGAAPNDNLVVKQDGAFEKNGFEINKTVFDKYPSLSLSNMTNPSTDVEATFPINRFTDEMIASFKNYGDAAIVTFVRIGSENIDPPTRRLNITQQEMNLLKAIKESGAFKKTIVLINSPMPMSMDWVDKEELGVDACLWVGAPGYYGTAGIVHVLTGKDADGKAISPSGHLPDSFAASASSSPAYVNFGNSSIAVYKEGVYVGYKYYETRYEDAVLGVGNASGAKGVFVSEGNWNYADEMGYPFGFGLSYTTFDQKIKNVEYNSKTDSFDVTVDVKNTGSVSGKASIQVYVAEPYTQYDKTKGLGKSAISFMAYDKVDVAPGETVTKTIPVEKYFLTTYDHVGEKSYILEGGNYYFALGNGAHEALNNVLGVKAPSAKLVDHLGQTYTANKDAVKMVTIEQDYQTYKNSHYDQTVKVTNQFDDADYNYLAEKNQKQKITYLDRQDWEASWPTQTTASPAMSSDTDMSQYYKKEMKEKSAWAGDGVEYNTPYINEITGKEEKLLFVDMSDVPLEGTVKTGKYAGLNGKTLWDAFIRQMNLDDLVISITDYRGLIDVAKIGKKGNTITEGAEGLLAKFQYGKKNWATGFPTGPTYTATFDHNMQSKMGNFFGEEALFCGVTSVNGPGVNINRTPYGSRASEYMSEDAMLNYNVASNVVSAARKKGLIMNVKHCLLNNQETGRQRLQTYCNEQAIREIYLKPFEGALTKGQGLGVITSYNRIGVRYAATHQPLMNDVMRKEWKYNGFIMCDALTGSNFDQYSNGPAMLYCGTDIFKLDGDRGTQIKQYINENDDGTLLDCLLRANKNIMYALSRSSMGGVKTEEQPTVIVTKLDCVPLLRGLGISFAVLTGCALTVYIITEVKSKKTKESK